MRRKRLVSLEPMALSYESAIRFKDRGYELEHQVIPDDDDDDDNMNYCTVMF
jgi:hypothetical protein